MLVCLVLIISLLESQSKFQMFTLYFSRHIGVPRCIPRWRFLTGLCKFLRNIYDEFLKFWETHRPKTWRSVIFSYLLSRTSQFPSFFHWLVFDLFIFFYCVTVKTICTFRRTKQQLWNIFFAK